MWDCLQLDWWCSFIPETLKEQPHHPNQSLLLLTQPPIDDVCPPPLCISFSSIAVMLTSWVNRRRRRCLLLILCSPFLLPLFCATCPLICAVEVCVLMCRRRRKREGESGDGRSSSDEGGGEVGLLQRYLEDQLYLVLESAYQWGDDDENVREEDRFNVEYFGSARALLQ